MRGAADFVDCGRWMTHKCYNLYSTVEMFTTLDGPAVMDAKARHWSKIAIFPQLYGVPVGILPQGLVSKNQNAVECGYRMVKNY